ncbi:MAG: RnfH family protein [Magnetococcales bacterium]|nr:RnfH family protein [Magnetococcales bacterium]
MKVAVAYAEAKKQMVMNIELEEGGTAMQAVQQSGIVNKFADLDLSTSKLGVWGKIVDNDRVLVDGERVEIYRPALGKPVKKSRPAKAPAAKTVAAESGSPADKVAAMKAKVAAAKAKKAAAAAGGDAAPTADVGDDKAAKMAAMKAKVAAAKAKKAAAAAGGDAVPAVEPATTPAADPADEKAAKMAAMKARVAAAKAKKAAAAQS